jgi:RAD54-like protein 2
LKAGQKVIVLKSSKGICLQLQSGKVIAIRASQKPGLPLSKPDAAIPRMPPRQDGDVIDISNDDDEESGNSVRNNIDPLVKEASNSNPTDSPAKTVEHFKPDNMYKENKYRPNLLPRKPRPTSTLSPSTSTPLPPSNMHNQRSDSKFQPPAQSRWESPSQSNYSNNSNYQRNGNVNNSTSQYRSTNRKLFIINL